MVLDGPMNGAGFRISAEQMSTPALRPGDIVNMDTLPADKVGGIRQGHPGTRRGTRLSAAVLPRPEPDRTALRKAAARTVNTLWAAIGVLLESFKPDECANDFHRTGYGSI